MNRDDIDKLLANEETFTPSPGFLASVMQAVEREAAMPAPLAFPWKRAWHRLRGARRRPVGSHLASAWLPRRFGRDRHAWGTDGGDRGGHYRPGISVARSHRLDNGRVLADLRQPGAYREARLSYRPAASGRGSGPLGCIAVHLRNQIFSVTYNA